MSKSVLVLFVVALFVGASLQIGTLWVNEIWGNQDTNRVVIEDAVFDDSTMLVDFIDGLTDVGVFVEDTHFIEGDVFVPGDIFVHGFAKLQGPLLANGGIYADDGYDGYSFVVEDDTGNTIVKGQLRPFGGINADNCLFTVHNITGDTRICCALLNPNGGIEVGNELFTVSDDDGSFRTKNNGIVSLDFIQGSATAADKLVTRVPAATQYGGNTIIKAQDGVSVGGPLYIIPGDGVTANGDILFGREFADNLYIGRSGIDGSASAGGETIFGGQDGFEGRGGDLVFYAGNANVGGSFTGGDIELDVGLSYENGLPGRILLGTDVSGESSFTLIVTRPLAVGAGANAGTTSWVGQSTALTSPGTTGGDLYLQAGDVTDGAGLAGDLSIIPGISSNNVGNIQLGNGGSDLFVTRLDVYDPAGDTYFVAQDTGSSGIPGDFFLNAGNSNGAAQLGGDLWLMPGTTPEGVSGEIIWGNVARDLLVSSLPTGGGVAVSDTNIRGQDSNFASGGDSNYYAGDGNVAGGRLSLLGGGNTITSTGVTASVNGGDVTVLAGDGIYGGSIFVNGGFGTDQSGGTITVTAGSSTAATGGSINIGAGQPAANRGSIYVGPSADSLFVNNVLTITQSTFVTLNAGANNLIISNTVNGVGAAAFSNILTFNGRNLLRNTVPNVPVTTSIPLATFADAYTIVNSMSHTLSSIVCALGPSGHGLWNVVTEADVDVSCPLN